jgi:hypothetical protein
MSYAITGLTGEEVVEIAVALRDKAERMREQIETSSYVSIKQTYERWLLNAEIALERVNSAVYVTDIDSDINSDILD